MNRTLVRRAGAITKVAVHVPSGDDDASSSVQAGGAEYVDDDDYRCGWGVRRMG